MSPFVKAELIKVISIRSTFGLILGAGAAAAFGAVSTIMSGEPGALAGRPSEQQYYVLASIIVALFALIGGIRVVTDEFRHGSVVPTILVAPDRRDVVLSKAVVAFALGAVSAVVISAVVFLTAAGLLSVRRITPAWSASDLEAWGGLVIVSALWAVIGVGVGAVVRHQVAAIVGGIVWVLVVENLGTLLGPVGPWLPGQAAHAVARAAGAGRELLDPAVALGVLCGYAAATLMLALASFVRRDIVTG